MKQIILTSSIAFLALAFLAGCGEELKSVEYYEKHIDEAKAKQKECKAKEADIEKEYIEVAKGKTKPSTFFQNCFNSEQAIMSAPDPRVNNDPNSHPEAFKWK